jgi:hypothetical protein
VARLSVNGASGLFVSSVNLDVLGKGLRRTVPAPVDNEFSALLRQLDHVGQRRGNSYTRSRHHCGQADNDAACLRPVEKPSSHISRWMRSLKRNGQSRT